MPFLADTRVGLCNIELNAGTICGELEIMLEKDYVGDVEKGSPFWLYVCKLEERFSVNYNCGGEQKFWDWFIDNYNNYEEWDDVEMLFEGDDDAVDEREYKIENLRVIGHGTMSFYDAKDMLDQIVKCKNGYWKQKGETVRIDGDGDLCITDDEYDFHDDDTFDYLYDDDTDEDEELEQCVGVEDARCVGKKLYKTEELDLGMCRECYDFMEAEANAVETEADTVETEINNIDWGQKLDDAVELTQ